MLMLREGFSFVVIKCTLAPEKLQSCTNSELDHLRTSSLFKVGLFFFFFFSYTAWKCFERMLHSRYVDNDMEIDEVLKISAVD